MMLSTITGGRLVVDLLIEGPTVIASLAISSGGVGLQKVVRQAISLAARTGEVVTQMGW